MRVKHGVPKGRLNLKHDSASFDLVTVQRREVFEALLSQRKVLPNAEYSEHLKLPMFARAYRWMAVELCSRRETHGAFSPSNGAMFWLWGHITREALVSDALEYGDGHIILRCQVPRTRVLLSDFDAYHGVLYGSVVYTPNELATSYALAESDHWFGTPLEQKLSATYGGGWDYEDLAAEDQALVRATWSNSLIEAPPSKGDWAQACISHLELGDITEVYQLPSM